MYTPFKDISKRQVTSIERGKIFKSNKPGGNMGGTTFHGNKDYYRTLDHLFNIDLMQVEDDGLGAEDWGGKEPDHLTPSHPVINENMIVGIVSMVFLLRVLKVF